MVMQKPVIASRLGSLPEIVDDSMTGLLFEPGDVQDLSRKIAQLYADPERCRRMGETGRAKVDSHYSPDLVYARLEEILTSALQSNPS
jgi:glycosyltransferase involved in cell wall biosynthesis